jgi:membrane-bound lytic murein transglycosylase
MSVRNGFLIAAAVSLLSVGCASGPRPTAEITRARTLIEQAEKAGAQRYAAVELDSARNKLREADALAKDGENDSARARANEASAAAELATARISSAQAQQAAEEVQKGTESLQREAARGDTTPASPKN